MQVKFFKSPHESIYLRTDRFRELFEWSNVIFMEESGTLVRDRTVKLYNDISSKGKSNVKLSNIFVPIQKEFFRYLRNSGKPVEVENSPFVHSPKMDIVQDLLKSFKLYVKNHTEEAFSITKKIELQYLEADRRRDEKIAADILEMEKKYGEDGRMLGILGIAHFPEIEFQKLGKQVESVYPTEKFPISLEIQICRNYRKNGTLTDDEVKLYFLTQELGMSLLGSSYSSKELYDAYLQVDDKIKPSDFEDLARYIEKYSSPFWTSADENTLILNWFRKKGLKL